MAKYQTIEAAVRSEFGKGSARRARVAGQIPAVVYGADVESNLHVTIDHRTFAALVRQEGVNAVLELDIEGQKQLTMIKHIDQNVLTFNIDHLDLLAIKRGEKVEVDVPVIVEGEPAPGTMWVQDADTIKVEADVLSIPEEFTVSIEGLELGAQITAADIKLEGDTTLVEDPETLIVNIVLPAVEEEETEEDEAAEEEAATE
ncbi:50S ribosomal protein L25/general stress protein Ctc [Corynebacterium glutamicum]|jgi:large subunit ribosomal protein L25|uniref:50S ribosomal protein L25/general stress protein Ctc n=1 Tax=Corynebacterium glutamicum TaxID=1718 RepID=UPI003B58FB78